jgi:hypothetical protein
VVLGRVSFDGVRFKIRDIKDGMDVVLVEGVVVGVVVGLVEFLCV